MKSRFYYKGCITLRESSTAAAHSWHRWPHNHSLPPQLPRLPILLMGFVLSVWRQMEQGQSREVSWPGGAGLDTLDGWHVGERVYCLPKPFETIVQRGLCVWGCVSVCAISLLHRHQGWRYLLPNQPSSLNSAGTVLQHGHTLTGAATINISFNIGTWDDSQSVMKPSPASSQDPMDCCQFGN